MKPFMRARPTGKCRCVRSIAGTCNLSRTHRTTECLIGFGDSPTVSLHLQVKNGSLDSLNIYVRLDAKPSHHLAGGGDAPRGRVVALGHSCRAQLNTARHLLVGVWSHQSPRRVYSLISYRWKVRHSCTLMVEVCCVEIPSE